MNSSVYLQAVNAIGHGDVPLSAEGSQLLRSILERDGDADIRLSDRLQVRYSWNRAKHVYLERLAAEITSGLLGELRVKAPVAVVSLASGSFSQTGGFPAWSHGPRLIWVMREPEVLELRVRPQVEHLAVPAGGIEAPAEGALSLPPAIVG